MFTINVEGLRRSRGAFSRAFLREVDDAMDSAGELAVQHVRKHSSFKRRSATGSLKDATEYKLVRLKNGRVTKIRSKKRTAHWLEYGTRPHIIRARRKKALRFVQNGRVRFAKQVQHPGTRPTKFLYNATDAAFRYAGHALRGAMARASKRF